MHNQQMNWIPIIGSQLTFGNIDSEASILVSETREFKERNCSRENYSREIIQKKLFNDYLLQRMLDPNW